MKKELNCITAIRSDNVREFENESFQRFYEKNFTTFVHQKYLTKMVWYKGKTDLSKKRQKPCLTMIRYQDTSCHDPKS